MEYAIQSIGSEVKKFLRTQCQSVVQCRTGWTGIMHECSGGKRICNAYRVYNAYKPSLPCSRLPAILVQTVDRRRNGNQVASVGRNTLQGKNDGCGVPRITSYTGVLQPSIRTIGKSCSRKKAIEFSYCQNLLSMILINWRPINIGVDIFYAALKGLSNLRIQRLLTQLRYPRVCKQTAKEVQWKPQVKGAR